MSAPGATTPRFSWAAALSLLATVVVAAVLWRASPRLYGAMDIVLHGGWSFVLCLGGQYLAWRRAGSAANEWAVFAIVIVIGLGVEVVQHYLRIDSTLGDMTINTLGALAGWAAWRTVKPYLVQAGRQEER